MIDQIDNQRFLPYGKQNVSEQDINEVINVLKSDFLTQGPTVNLFEEAISKNGPLPELLAIQKFLEDSPFDLDSDWG